jgi:hypothetical protein
MREFHKSIVELESRKELLSLIKNENDEVIREKYGGRLTNKKEVDYATSDVKCSCSRFKQKGISLHINFRREV